MMPDHLKSIDARDEQGLSGGSEAVKHGSISHEKNINRQLDRIAYLRSSGFDWSEAVYQLRDMVVGLEDQEFWDGIPEKVRENLQDDPEQLAKAKEEYAQYGWNSYPVRAYQTPDGRTVYRPTADNLSVALRIIMRLLARKNILWDRRRRTRFSPFGEMMEEE